MVGAQRTEQTRKINLLGLSLQRLLRYADEEEDMLNRIVTGEESWMHHYRSESKRASLQWKHPTSPKVTPSAGKVMLTVFWYSQGVLLAHFQKRRENGKSSSYCEVLLKLRDAIPRKPAGQLEGKRRPAHKADNFTADILENVGASTSHNPMGLRGL
jgi:hypothetical protein